MRIPTKLSAHDALLTPAGEAEREAARHQAALFLELDPAALDVMFESDQDGNRWWCRYSGVVRTEDSGGG